MSCWVKVAALLAIALVACGDSESGQGGEKLTEAWVCYNPASEYHGHICTDQCYWVGQRKVESSYCWLLKDTDCPGELEFEWQRENCHLLSGENN